MEPIEATFTQYQALAARRHHFGWQFWFTIAFSLSMLMAGAAVFRESSETLRGWLILGAGLALVQTAYIAHRIRQIEDDCEREMRVIEDRWRAAGDATPTTTPWSKRFGARTLVTISLALAGAGLAALGVSMLT